MFLSASLFYRVQQMHIKMIQLNAIKPICITNCLDQLVSSELAKLWFFLKLFLHVTYGNGYTFLIAR